MKIQHATTSVPGARSRPRGSDRSGTEPLEVIAEHLRRHPRIDGGAFVTVDEGRRRMRPAVSWFASPVLAEAIEPVLDRPYERNSPGFTEAALERGRPLFLPRVEDWEAAPSLRQVLERGGEEAGAELWTAFVRASVIAYPVRDSLRRVVGALVVACFDPARPLTREDLGAVAVMADLAALAHERTTWLEQETARTRTELLLKRAAADVSGSLETEEVLRHVVEHARPAVDADRALVSRMLASGELARAASSPAEGGPEIDPAQAAQVAKTRTADTFDRPLPSVHVPLVLGPRLFGVLSLARSEGPGFSEDEVEVLLRLARTSVGAIVNAAHFEQERRVARALTRGFVPDSPQVGREYETAALYEPAGGELAGGDVYGLWTRPGGDLALLIGDVAGKGAATAGTGAMTRFFVEARSWDGAGPAEVLTRTGDMLRARLPADTFVTAFMAVLRDGELRYANAGQLPPLLMRAQGLTSPLEGHGLPLGVEEGVDYDEHTLTMDHGDLLYSYTDGLTEARSHGEMLGVARLREALDGQRGAGGSVQDLVHAVHEAVRAWAGILVDDSTALAVRRR
ncbi:MAG TPA: SpoIIE family protein phosphatase [Thermoleophilaceae bacterium]|nr:SpoIIE family protein phosphatase [Thermoleophilaceae bacterium]